MTTLTRSLALAGLILLSAGSACAGVSVTFVHPESYADMPFATQDREQVLKDLSEFFDKLAAGLPAGQDLKIEVLDLDLAGRLRPNYRGGNQDIRIMRGGADWPRMHLRYTLSAGGRVLRSGDEKLSDMNYLDHPRNARDSGDALHYEKQMIDDWFKKTITGKQPS
jgi:hypothetical protein